MFRGVVPCVFALMLACGGCGDDVPERGSALREQDGSFARFPSGFGTDQEFLLAYAAITNRGEHDLVVRRIEPLVAEGSGGSAEVVRVLLSRRRDGGLPLGVYATDPPTLDVRANPNRGQPRCVSQEYEDAEGFRLEPGKSAVLALHVRPNRAGIWRLEAERVFYEVDGEEFFQDVPFRAEIPFRAGAEREMATGERACATSTTVLPGWD